MFKSHTIVCLAIVGIYITAACRPASASSYKLAPAGFQVRSETGTDSGGLAKVNGVHLDGGEDRADNRRGERYNPGEPSANYQLVRWEAQKMPIKIWISPGIKLPEIPFEEIQGARVDMVTGILNTAHPFEGLETANGWTEHTNEVVAAGIEEWREFETNDHLFSFVFVDDPRMADVMVFFTDSFKDATGPGGIAVGGITSAQVYPIAKAHSMKIRQKPVVIELSTLTDGTDEKMYGASAHEFGHALGIKAHSDKRQDIMFGDRIVNHLSPSDKATIRWLYHQTPQWVM